MTARIGVLAVGLAANSTRMNFIITALPEQDFECYFAMSGAELAGKLARRMVADEKPGYPCRVSLLDAEIGEEVLLVNYTHQLADSPFRAAHAVYVRRGAARARPAPGEVPEMLRGRKYLSLRGFDAAGMLMAAELAAGEHLAGAAAKLLEDREIEVVHIHNAGPGCYLASARRG